MKFVIKTNNGQEEIIKLNDPLYSSNFINNKEDTLSLIEIDAKFDSSIDLSLFDKKYKLINGYAKYYVNGKFFQWRQVLTNNVISDNMKVNFHCLYNNSIFSVK